MLEDLPYTWVREKENGKKIWYFSPPYEYRKSGLVPFQTFTDGRTARVEIPRALARIEDYKKGKLLWGDLTTTSTVRQALLHYRNSTDFKVRGLAKESRRFEVVCAMVPSHIKEFGDYRLCDLDLPNLTKVITTPRDRLIFSHLFNWCVSQKLLPFNPLVNLKFPKVAKGEGTTREVQLWERGQVERFLDTAFSDFKWRNVGVLSLLSYDLTICFKDVTELTWDKVTEDSIQMRDDWVLPIEENLSRVLINQRKDWDFQPYVAPLPYRPYRPYYRSVFDKPFKDILKQAQLPETLKFDTLQHTAVHEMVEGGAGKYEILQVLGAKDLKALDKFNINTDVDIRKALSCRK